MSAHADCIEIQATSRAALEEQLEAAIRQLQQLAMLTKTCGILVTRHRPGHYTAALCDRVPFGTTQELDR